MINAILIMGRMVANPELKQTTNGTYVTSFVVAVDRDYVPKDGERQADFIPVVAWSKTAEFICKFFRKGQMIAIQGTLQTRNYEDKSGNNRKAVEVVAEKASFCGSKAETTGSKPIPEEKPTQQEPDFSDDDDGELPF